MKKISKFSISFFVFSILVLSFSNSKANAFGLDMPFLGGKDKKNAETTKEGKTSEELLAQALLEIDNSKKLYEQSKAIKQEMNHAVSIVRNLQGVSGSTMSSMGDALKEAMNANDVSNEKQKDISGMLEFKIKESASLRDSVQIVGKNDQQNRELNSFLKEQANIFIENAKPEDELKHIDSIKRHLAISSINYQTVASECPNVKTNINKSIDMFKEKGKDVAVKSIAQVGVLALQAKVLNDAIIKAKDELGFLKAGKIIKQIKTAIVDVNSLRNVLQDYYDDYQYIESKSDEIVVLGESLTDSLNKAISINTDIKTKLTSIGINSKIIDEMVNELKAQQTASIKETSEKNIKAMDKSNDDMDKEEAS